MEQLNTQESSDPQVEREEDDSPIESAPEGDDTQIVQGAHNRVKDLLEDDDYTKRIGTWAASR